MADYGRDAAAVILGVAVLGSALNAGARRVKLLFNWILPVPLVLGAVKYTQHAADTRRRSGSEDQLRRALLPLTPHPNPSKGTS